MRKTDLILGALFLISTISSSFALGKSDAYQAEYQHAVQGMLSNIQSSGAVVASPSRSEPNYYYNWVRDTSLTMKAVVTLAYDPTTSSSLKSSLLGHIDQWIKWESNLQLTPKLTDLGEPRFNLNGTANNDPWGRPQNDGPAIRAQTAIRVANQWINEGRLSDVEQRLYKGEIPANTLIKRDLEYVANHWQDQSFDLWEEEKGMHFYTLTMQKVALLKGADLANRLGDGGGANFYADQAAAIGQYLKQFYDAKTGTIVYALDVGNRLPQKTTQWDVSVLLAAIETYDGQFYVPVDQVRATVNSLIHQFQNEYPINQLKKGRDGSALGVGLGRYPGDKYSGTDFTLANAWFLSTLALGEFYCDLNKTQNRALALPQFNRVLEHMNPTGDLSEQFNRNNGFEQGANNLTWSYTAYVTAYRACF